MKNFLLFVVLTLSVAVPAGMAQVVEIQGYVKTSSGEPIKDVFIDDFGRTDENGYFRIASDTLVHYHKVLVLDKIGFVPKPFVLDRSNLTLDIVLAPEKDHTRWEFPKCSVKKAEDSRFVGKYLKLTVPKKLKYKSGVDTDYIYHLIGIKTDGKTSWLRGGLGNLYGGSNPGGETLIGLQSYSYRRTSTGTDWRGVTKEGHYWRYLGSVRVFETYHYVTESKKTADVFDQILDSVCFDESDLP